MNKERLKSAVETFYGLSNLVWKETLGGLSSKNFRFTTAQGNYVVKIYGNWSLRTLASTEIMTQCAARHDVPVVIPLRGLDKRSHYRVEGQTIAVLPYVDGAILHENDLVPRAHEQSALVLAKLHAVKLSTFDSLPSSRRRMVSVTSFQKKSQLLYADIARITEITGNTWARDTIRASIETKESILKTYSSHALRELDHSTHLIHGDFHNENIIFSSDHKVAAVLDWEDCRLGHGASDVMMWIHFACMNQGLNEASAARARHFLAAYQSVCPTSYDVMKKSLQRFNVELASSLFFEERLLALMTNNGHNEVFCYAKEIQRDQAKMIDFLTYPNRYFDAVLGGY